MTTPTTTTESTDRGALWLALVGLVWQGAIVAVAFRYGPALGKFQDGLGVSLPFVSDAYWDTYRFWPIAPLVCGVPILLAIRRGRRVGMGAAICAIATAAFFTCWTLEAVLAPLAGIIAKVG